MTARASDLNIKVVGRTTMPADEISGLIGTKLVCVPDGPVLALLLIEGGAVHVDTAGGLVFRDDKLGTILPAGAAFIAPSAADLRVVASERGARVEVVFLAPAGAAA